MKAVNNSLFENKPVNVSIRRYPRLYDYFVDFLGVLIPGITFYSIFITIILGLVHVLASFNIKVELQIIQYIDNFRIEFAIISLILSYILGFLFFRRGPTSVDIKSVKTNWKKIKGDNPPIDDSSKEKLDEKVEWPYEFLKRYLQFRLPHLANLVPWESSHVSKEKLKEGFNRTKTFMNVLKDNIRFYLPDKYYTIARNEAHIRLSSSVWFAMKYLMAISLLSTIATALIWLVLEKKDISGEKIYFYRMYMSFTIMVFISSIIIKRQIQKFLFYQRIREIVFILNTAYQAAKNIPEFATEFFKYKIWKKQDFK